MHSTPFDHLPLKNPGNPELASVARFLLWIIRGQKRVLATGTVFGVVNLLSLAILPRIFKKLGPSYVIGRWYPSFHWHHAPSSRDFELDVVRNPIATINK